MGLSYRVTLLAFLVGSGTWFLDALMDAGRSGGRPFVDVLIWDVPGTELAERAVSLICITGFGVVMGRLLEQRRKASETMGDLRRQNEGLLKARIEEIRGREERYRTIVEDQTELVVRWLPDGTRTFANAAYCRYFGEPVEQVIGSSWPASLTEERRQEALGRVRRLRPEDPVTTNEYRMERADGSPCWREWTDRGIFDEEGRLVEVQSVGRDITERKRAEEALRESEEKYRALVEQSRQGIVIQDGGRILFANSRAAEIMGFTVEEFEKLSAESMRNLIHADDRKMVVERFRRRLKDGDGPSQYEFRAVRRDGAVRQVEVFPQRVEYQGKPAIQCAFVDNTERKRTEEERTLLAAVVEQGPSLVVITDVEGTIQYVNPAFERVTGYGSAEVVGKNPRILKSGEHDDAYYRQLWDTLRRGEVWRGRFRNRKKDGSLYDEDATICPIRDAKGATVNYVAVKRDVTQELALEEQLRQAQKLEAVGLLAGGVAHDFNNLLTTILGNAELLKETLWTAGEAKESLDQIEWAGQRAAALTSQLLAFGRRQPSRRALVDLSEIVDRLHGVIRSTLGGGIELEVVVGEGLGRVRADAGQMEQVMLNLVLNARDAMPEGGRLVIETRNVEAEERQGGGNGDSGRWVVLSVSDTGCGMDTSTKERVFEPFFTTKPVGKGTGLGLSVVFGIVKQSGGRIEVSSEAGKGSAFRLYFPRVEEAGASSNAIPAGRRQATGRGTILLAEDEDGVRYFVRGILEHAGYRVLAAENGARALELAAENDGKIDLLVTDVLMPDMNGAKLAEAMRGRDGDVNVLFLSGYTPETIGGEGGLGEGAQVLGKPFHSQDLLRRVEEAMEGVRGAHELRI